MIPGLGHLPASCILCNGLRCIGCPFQVLLGQLEPLRTAVHKHNHASWKQKGCWHWSGSIHYFGENISKESVQFLPQRISTTCCSLLLLRAWQSENLLIPSNATNRWAALAKRCWRRHRSVQAFLASRAHGAVRKSRPQTTCGKLADMFLAIPMAIGTRSAQINLDSRSTTKSPQLCPP